MTSLALLAPVALLLAAVDAHAQAPGLSNGFGPVDAAAPPDRWEPGVALNVHAFAFGAPAGTFAVEGEAHVARWLSFSLGTGAAAGGQQTAAMVRLRGATDGVFAGGIGAGVSYGAYEDWFVLWNEPERREDVVWGNAEAYLQWRSVDGLQVKLYAGATTQLDGGRCVGGPYGECDTLPTSMPYVGTAFGIAL